MEKKPVDARTNDPHGWLEASHFSEILAVLGTTTTGAITSVQTSRGLDVVVSVTRRAPERIAHLITLAGLPEELPALLCVADRLSRALGVEAKIVAEVAHVTTLFTLTSAEAKQLQALLVSPLSTGGS